MRSWAFLKKDILYIGTKEVAEIDATKTWVTFVDHLGSPRLIWDGTANPVKGTNLLEQKFMPFGEALAPTTGIRPAKGFTNHEQTDDSGLIYMQARMYLPWMGRFASPDPARDQHFEQTQSWNIYSYVQNDPTMSIDPTGMIGGPVSNFFSGLWDGVKSSPKNWVHSWGSAIKATTDFSPKGMLTRLSNNLTGGLLGAGMRGLSLGRELRKEYKAGGSYGVGKVLGREGGTEGINLTVTAGIAKGVGAAVGSASAPAPAVGEGTTLWRAVDSVELGSIRSTESFTPSPGGSMGKYFSFTEEGAAAEAKGLSGSTGEAYTLVKTKAPAGALDPANNFTDTTTSGRVPSTTVDNANLGKLSKPEVQNSTPIPGKKD